MPLAIPKSGLVAAPCQTGRAPPTVRGVKEHGERAFESWRARGGDLAAIAIALVLGSLAADATSVDDGRYAVLNGAVGLAAVTALIWRRRFPRSVALITFAATAAAPLAGGAAVVGVFTLASRLDRRQALALAGLSVAPAALGMILFPDVQSGQAVSAFVGVVLTLAAYGWGLAVRSRTLLVASLAERAERAESEQRARVDAARRAERTRIASEMHDVLAHRLSLLSLQAATLESRPDHTPDGRAETARLIRTNAHLALQDLRTVIGVLRDGGGDDLTPQPTAADIPNLVGECRAAGMQVDAAVADATSIPLDLGRHAYRVAQEGLTNARKHAPDKPVRLVVAGAAGRGLTIEVINRTDASAVPSRVPGAGVGLVGLRERIELVGGTLEVDRAEPDVHRLRAWIPWTP